MRPNPILKKMGFADDDRVVIIHADDIGMCQASVAAFSQLADAGIVSSGAIMVPCPWFLEAAAYARSHPQADLGVHLTLTSEWETYRWGPVSTRDQASGLLDAEGCFYRTRPEAQEHADPEAVQVEMTAQVERALAAGIEPTHVDTHMGTVAHPKFIGQYVQLAFQYHLPPMLPRLDKAGLIERGMDPVSAAGAAELLPQLEEQGLPLLDSLSTLELDAPDERLEQAKQALAHLPAGLTHFIIHPSVDTPELRAITPDWRARVADFHTFQDESLLRFIHDQGIHIIGYRDVREAMRNGQAG